MEYIQPKESKETSSRFQLSSYVGYPLAFVLGLVAGFAINEQLSVISPSLIYPTRVQDEDVNTTESLPSAVVSGEEADSDQMQMFTWLKPDSVSGTIKSVSDVGIVVADEKSATEQPVRLVSETIITALDTSCGIPVVAMCGSEFLTREGLAIGDKVVIFLIKGLEPATASSIQVIR